MADPRFPLGSQTIKVLVVDDDEVMTWTVQRMLRRHAEVTVATSADHALEQIGRESFDAILCDLVPTVDAGDLYRAVRELDAELAERILFMTGGAPPTTEADAFLEVVADHELPKPFDRTALLVALRRMLGAVRT